jgi:hypothetical protein
VAVSDLMERISLDRRHAAFTLLSDQAFVSQRLFSTWAMGFFHMEAIEAIAPPGLLTDTSDFARAIAVDHGNDPAALLLRQYWAANASKLGRAVVHPQAAASGNG